MGAFEKLSPEQKQVLLLRYWEDHSLAEIAERLGKTPDAVAGLLYRAMKVMRSELA
jgi:RNA polymerase sigma-70 factor (ECF subfamily)